MLFTSLKLSSGDESFRDERAQFVEFRSGLVDFSFLNAKQLLAARFILIGSINQMRR